MKAIVLCARSPICHSCFRCSLLLVPLVFLLVCFALCQMALAVSPAPDGGYAGNNTAEGTSALFSLTSGADNTAIGFQALFHNTSGTYNSGEGFRALFSNTTGVLNTATGVQALNSNTIGAQNTASGVNALFSNTTASYNTANGTSALFHNTIGSQNTATGVNALTNTTTGNFNTADGVNTLYRNTGDSNTATGVQALFNNTSGSGNIAIGKGAGINLTTGDNNIDIGHQGVAGESGVIRVGAGGTHTDTFLTGLIHAGAVALTGSLSMTDPTTTIQFPATGGANAPMMSMFASGTANADRMVIAHSPSFPTWGLQYQDSSDTFRFLGAGSPVLTVGLANSTTTVFGTFVNNSDRNVKEDFAPVNAQAVLDHLQTLSLSTWKYKGADTRRHIGPMAQDFHAAFDGLLDLKSDDKTIAPLDEAGVAFAAIQALQKQVTELRAEKTALAEKLAALEARDQARETRLTRLENALDNHPARVVKAVLDLE
jgi:hypothetical protein